MALQQCPGTESFDTGQGRSVCEHEEEQLDLNVLDRQCGTQTQHLWETWGVQ